MAPKKEAIRELVYFGYFIADKNRYETFQNIVKTKTNVILLSLLSRNQHLSTTDRLVKRENAKVTASPFRVK